MLTTFLLPLQVCVSTSVCFTKCALLQVLVLPNVTSFVCCQIHFGKVFFLQNGYVLMKEAKSIVPMDDLDFGIRDVCLRQRCSIGMAPLIKLLIRT